MKTIILNGSPKSNISESNTEICIREFLKNMKQKCTVKYIIRENHEELAASLAGYDSILFFFPLYIHAMPGSVMRFMELLDKSLMSGKNIGFFIQAGFPESAQEIYVVNYLKNLSAQLGCNYLGTVVKGDTAAVYMFPDKYKKLYQQLNALGEVYDKSNSFDEAIVKELAFPFHISDYPRII